MQSFVRNFISRSSGNRVMSFCFGTLLALSCLTSPTFAAEHPPPIPAGPYSGDILTRSTLTGDWGGARNLLSSKGVTIDLSLTQITQGVVSGGKRSNWEYGGRGDLNLLIDTGKLGLWPGGFLTAELEGNFGNSVNAKTGTLMSVNTNQVFPTVGFDDLCLPALNFTQFLSEYFGVAAGKLDTTTFVMNEFARGKGDTQFMNLAFNIDPVVLLTIPYSTLGAGFVVLPTKDPKAAIIQLAVISSVGTAKSSGFDTLNGNKLTFVGQGRVRTDFFGLTGHQLVGVTYSNREFASIDQSLRFFLENRDIEKKKGSWSV